MAKRKFIYFTVLSATMVCSLAFSQEIRQPSQSSKSANVIYEYYELDSLPIFMQDSSITTFVYKHLTWPADFCGTGTVIVSFVVRAEGSISDIKVEKGLCELCDKSVVKAVKMMNLWRPGRKNGLSVNSRLCLPIRYRLN
jgi:hypothetical protein